MRIENHAAICVSRPVEDADTDRPCHRVHRPRHAVRVPLAAAHIVEGSGLVHDIDRRAAFQCQHDAVVGNEADSWELNY